MSGLIHERTPEQVEIDAFVLARVKKGIALLEERYGSEWVDRFGGLEDFRISNVDCCVLGKIEGDYWSGRAVLAIHSDAQAADHGFDVHDGESDVGIWKSLQRIWTSELRALGVSGEPKDID